MHSINTLLLTLTAILAAPSLVSAQASPHHRHADFHHKRAGGLDDTHFYNDTSLLNKTIEVEPLPLNKTSGFRASAVRSYQLADSYTSSIFFSTWNFFQGADPTHGFVNYVDQNTAWSQGLIGTENGKIRMSVDSRNVADGAGRKSVRLTSKKAYTRGLFVVDVEHMPGAACGSWPAFWVSKEYKAHES